MIARLLRIRRHMILIILGNDVHYDDRPVHTVILRTGT